MKNKVCLTLLFLVTLLCNKLVAQTTEDSTRNVNWSFIDATTEIDKSHSPKKAALYSALLPGLGQAYNKKYWKLPILYGLGGYWGFKIYQNNRDYISYRDELFRRQLSSKFENVTFQTPEEFELLSTTLIQTRKENFRQERDRFILFTSILYAANIVDAVVDAHLTTFTVGKNDSELSFHPSIIPERTSVSAALEIQLRF